MSVLLLAATTTLWTYSTTCLLQTIPCLFLFVLLAVVPVTESATTALIAAPTTAVTRSAITWHRSLAFTKHSRLFGAVNASKTPSLRRSTSTTSPLSSYLTASRTARMSSSSSAVLAAMIESPAAERNKDPIWNVLSSKVFVPPLYSKEDDNAKDDTLRILEIAPGAGVHTLHFCTKLVETGILPFTWYPADMEESYRASTQAYVSTNPALLTDNRVVLPPLALTLDANGIVEPATIDRLHDVRFDVIFNCNMIHIAPWEAALGLMKMAGEKVRRKTGLLVLYGPFKVKGTCVDSNKNFDASLRERNPTWGIRDLEQVIEVAERIGGLEFLETIDMPANNLMVLFRKT